MLKKILKITGIVLGGLIGIALLYYIKAYVSTEKRINKVYSVIPEALTITYDSASLKKGEHLIAVKGCTGCHNQDLGGKVLMDSPHTIGVFTAKNLTRGKGGLPQAYDQKDWILALKHGLRRDGKALFYMPSHEFAKLSEADMAAVIAYCTTVPKVDKVLPESEVGPLGRILTDLDKVPLLSAEKIDHNARLVKEVTPEVSVAYGKYLSVSCQNCHLEHMKGGEALLPGFPVPADISSTGMAGKWTDEQFISTFRSGTTPEGKILNAKKMPCKKPVEAYTDTELKALHLYLKSL